MSMSRNKIFPQNLVIMSIMHPQKCQQDHRAVAIQRISKCVKTHEKLTRQSRETEQHSESLSTDEWSLLPTVQASAAQPQWHLSSAKGKGKRLDTCYSATYMSQTRDQQRFTISEVVADWHEPMVPQRIMWPSTSRANGQLDQRCS